MLMRMRRWTEKSAWDAIFIHAIVAVVHGEVLVVGVAELAVMLPFSGSGDRNSVAVLPPAWKLLFPASDSQVDEVVKR